MRHFEKFDDSSTPAQNPTRMPPQAIASTTGRFSHGSLPPMAKTTRKPATSASTAASGSASRASARTATSKASANSDAASRNAEGTKWTFLTNHSHVLVLLAQDSEMVLREVAMRIGITERAVQRIITDLEEGGFVSRERIGRRNRYQINPQATLRHPIESHRTIGDLLELVNGN